MEAVIIDHIPFEPDAEALATKLRIDGNSPDIETIVRFCREAREIARPKFVYSVAFIEEKGADFVVIDGVRFRSRVLSVNLAEVNRVFPCISTCGREIEHWSKNMSDMLERYWADQILEMVLRAAAEQGTSEIRSKFQLGKTAYMSPGSLEDWPLTGQTGLFGLLGKAPSSIGVELTSSLLMNPIKTVSRLMFESQTDYQNCCLCPRRNCPNRRAPHVPGLLHEKYGLSKKEESEQ